MCIVLDLMKRLVYMIITQTNANLKPHFLIYLFLTSYIFKDFQESPIKKNQQDHINIFFHDPKVCI